MGWMSIIYFGTTRENQTDLMIYGVDDDGGGEDSIPFDLIKRGYVKVKANPDDGWWIYKSHLKRTWRGQKNTPKKEN